MQTFETCSMSRNAHNIFVLTLNVLTAFPIQFNPIVNPLVPLSLCPRNPPGTTVYECLFNYTFKWVKLHIVIPMYVGMDETMLCNAT